MKAFVVLALVACSQAALIASPYAGIAGLPIGSNLAYTNLAYNNLAINNLPYAYNYAPVAQQVVAAPVAPAASQFNSADEFGNINYGYANINSAKHEVGNTYGGVTGSYSYVDANGITQTVNYIADALGYRVAATNLPIAKSVELAQPVFDLVGPAPVDDTEEVKAAKAEFAQAFEAAQAASASRRKRQAELATLPASTAPLTIAAPAPLTIAAPYTYAAAPYAYAAAPLGYAAAAPVAITASAPAARDAVLTKIQLNPGHAIAYIVN
jgi:hypothetical protein